MVERRITVSKKGGEKCPQAVFAKSPRFTIMLASEKRILKEVAFTENIIVRRHSNSSSTYHQICLEIITGER